MALGKKSQTLLSPVNCLRSPQVVANPPTDIICCFNVLFTFPDTDGCLRKHFLAKFAANLELIDKWKSKYLLNTPCGNTGGDNHGKAAIERQ